MKSFFLTNRGKVRQINEDSCGVYHNKDGQILAVVADGMGGHLAGDVASHMTTSQLKSYWEASEKLST
ncbi:protein phosphatase, partial [Kocuria rosea]